ncbi:hypothetical protein ACUPZ6_001549 [Campylobacter coli]
MNKINPKEIYIEVAGAISHKNTLKLLLRNYKEFNLAVYDSAEYCAWNGGRINNDNKLNDDTVTYYNKNGIGFSIAFTNFEIDLNDPIGNKILKQLNNNSKNAIIITNDNLNEYVKNNFKYKRICSITKHPSDITINQELINYYKKLELEYDYIVPRFEMTLNPDFYNKITPSKYMIMLNDTCSYGCKLFREHFEAISKLNRDYSGKNPWELVGFEKANKIHECWLPYFNPDVGSEKDRLKYGDLLGMDLSEIQIYKCLKIGYRSFKIMGREINDVQDFTWNIKTFLNRVKLAVNKFNTSVVSTIV